MQESLGKATIHFPFSSLRCPLSIVQFPASIFHFPVYMSGGSVRTKRRSHSRQHKGIGNKQTRKPEHTNLSHALPPVSTFHFPASSFHFPFSSLHVRGVWSHKAVCHNSNSTGNKNSKGNQSTPIFHTPCYPASRVGGYQPGPEPRSIIWHIPPQA